MTINNEANEFVQFNQHMRNKGWTIKVGGDFEGEFDSDDAGLLDLYRSVEEAELVYLHPEGRNGFAFFMFRNGPSVGVLVDHTMGKVFAEAISEATLAVWPHWPEESDQ